VIGFVLHRSNSHATGDPTGRADDRGVFVMLNSRLPRRLAVAFRVGGAVSRR